MKKALFVLAMMAAPVPAFAQAPATPAAPPAASAPASASAPAADADLEERTALATKMAELTPPSEAVNTVIRRIVASVPADQRAIAQKSMTESFEYQRFHDFVVKTMVDTFTTAELKEMVAYHSSPEAASIAQKMPGYERKIQPEMTRMIDTAMMVARTGKGPDYKPPSPAPK
jgi:hypothetical protein